MIEATLRGEARDVYGWSNGPGDTYGEHEHGYTKLLYCTRGSIDFVLVGGDRVAMRPGDRLVLSRTALAAVAVTFFLMGSLTAAYGPLLEHLARRFEVSLSVAGAALSAQYAGAVAR